MSAVVNATEVTPPSRNGSPPSIAATRSRPASGSTVSGDSPASPSNTAPSVPWPRPVAANDPYRSTCTPTTDDTRSPSSSTKLFAARIGPTVWELEGPTPIEKRSKTLTAMGIRYRIAIGGNLRTGRINIRPIVERSSHATRP